MAKDWLALLTEAVQGSNKTAVARELGVSRTAVSLLVAGKYCGRTERMAARVMARYSSVDCPHQGKPVNPDTCRKYCGQAPSSSPAALRQWRACRACPNNPNREEATA